MPVKSLADNIFSLFGAQEVDHCDVAVTTLQHIHVTIIDGGGRLVAPRHPDFVRPNLNTRLVPEQRNRSANLQERRHLVNGGINGLIGMNR